MTEEGTRTPRSGWIWALAPPLAAFIAVNLVLLAAAHFDGFDYFSARSWVRWDSFHYLEMASRGITFERCTIPRLFDLPATFDAVRDLLGFEVTGRDACGNAGWFPGYGLLIRLVGVTGMSHDVAGVALAVTFQIATLVGLWVWFLRHQPRWAALLALAAGAFFFGHVYYRAVFPMSLVTFMVLLHLRLVVEKRWIAAGAAGAIAAFSYPTAYLLAPVTGLWILLERKDRWREALAPAATIFGLVIAGFGAVHLYYRIETGVWDAFFEVQSQFGYALGSPTTRFLRAVEPVLDNGVELATIPRLHTVLVGLLVTTLLTVGFRAWSTLTPVERWAVLFIVPTWLFPLALGGRSSLYRIESVLLPAILLLPVAPRVVQVASVAVLGALSYPMALLFLRNVLV